MRLLICAGGTGGGVYPALAVLQAYQDAKPARLESVLWVGGEGGMEAALVQRAGIPFRTIPAAGLHGVGLRALPGNIIHLLKGLSTSRAILRKFQPEAILFTGGYVAVPMALSARFPGQFSRPHSLVFVPDIEPGLALKTIIRFADLVAVTVEKTREFLPAGKKSAVTGYPVRRELKKWTREDGQRTLHLDPSLRTLLVTGGSKGARSINQALVDHLLQLLAEMQVIHITGELAWPEIQAIKATLPQPEAYRYFPFPYLHEEMGAALASADLVVSRAGASTLGEYPYFGLPAVLVPYPYAWRYQQMNAAYLSGHGAAITITDEDLQSQLMLKILELMNNPDKLEHMKQNMASLAHPRAEYEIASLIPGYEKVDS